jgi:hypothetical protein
MHPKAATVLLSSVYLQCIGESNTKRRECRARAEWFGEEARSELIAGWPLVALGPIVVVWPLTYLLVLTVRWIGRGFHSRSILPVLHHLPRSQLIKLSVWAL